VLVKSGRRPDAGGRKLQRGYFMETAAIPGPQPAEFPAVSGQPHSTAIEKRKAMSPYRFMLVAKQPFFKGLNAQQLQLLTDMAIEIKFQPGEVIFQEGSPANRFYVILEGKVVLESKLKPPGMVAIQPLGPGDELGWSWLFRSSNLLLTARALEPTRTIFFYGTQLRKQCEQDHELGYQLMHRIAEVATQFVRAMEQCLMDCTLTTYGDGRPK
jgi:CRP/FNR family cyclic AMP-dependent transcriptional regulator